MMLGHLLLAFNLAIFVFFVVKEAYLAILMVLSRHQLRSDDYVRSHSRVQELLTSDTTPPITVVIPAYNEQAGIVESVRSMAMLHYPRLEILVVNDGSRDTTVERLVKGFDMVPIDAPYRQTIPTRAVRRIYRSRTPLKLRVLDKENGGRSDAVNAGINAAEYPYVLVTDADMIFEDESLLRAIRPFVEDRTRTVAVGGNVRPLNGSSVRAGKVVKVALPSTLLELAQVVEYLRSFLGSRPGWSSAGTLPIISGAFGLFSRQALVEVGGYRTSHLGEDMEITFRLHRHFRRTGRSYRIVYAADAVAWTEVPRTAEVLRRQRIRWHRGLMQVTWQYKGMLLNPRYGLLGLLTWPLFFLFEFLAPILEFLGWVAVPLSVAYGFISWQFAVPLVFLAMVLGTGNSVAALYLDERFGYFPGRRETLRLIGLAWVESFGLRQRTVWWRIRALFWHSHKKTWGDMQRAGVGNLAKRAAPLG